MPKISIILPIYNVEKYLRRCVDSVLSQTLEDIEIILATDGPDECDKICEEYAQKDSRVKIVSHPGSYGLAFNKSLEIAQGEYIGIVETDDWCDKTMYEKMYTKAKENNADVVKCGFWFAYDDEKKNRKFLYDKFKTYNLDGSIVNRPFSVYDYPYFLKSHPAVWSCIYKKSFIIENNIKMIEDRVSYIDAPFHYETAYKAKSYYIIDEPLYFYYQDNPSQTVQNIKIYDGLNAEIYAYQKISQYPKIFAELKEGFVLATIQHILWNYEQFKNENQRELFIKAAHDYINTIDLSGCYLIYLDNYLKDFFYAIKNGTYFIYPKRIVKYRLYLFKILPLIRINNVNNLYNVYLFEFIKLCSVEKRNDRVKIKLFGLFNFLTLKSEINFF